MERNINENFVDYKARRAVANLAVKNINKDSKGGSLSSRQILRDSTPGAKLGGYGASLQKHFDNRRASV